MLSAHSPVPRVVGTLKSTGANGTTTLRDLLKNLASDTSRLTYRKHHQSKSSKSPVVAQDHPKLTQLEARNRFLPLLPLPKANEYDDKRKHSSTQTIDNRVAAADELPETVDAAELPLWGPTACSAPSRVTKVYGRKSKTLLRRREVGPRATSFRTPELQAETFDNDHLFGEEAETAPAEEQNTIVQNMLPRRSERKRKRKGTEEKGSNSSHDDPATMKKSPVRRKKHRKRLPISELTLVKSFISPVTLDTVSKKGVGRNQHDAIDPIETQASPRALKRRKTKETFIRRPKPRGKQRSLHTLPTSETISLKDFKFPVITSTPERVRSADWTPGSGFAGLGQEFVHERGAKRRQRTWCSDPVPKTGFCITKPSSKMNHREETLSPGKKRLKKSHPNHEDNTLSGSDTPQDSDLLGSPNETSAEEGSHGDDRLSQKGASTNLEDGSSNPERGRATGRGVSDYVIPTHVDSDAESRFAGSLQECMSPVELQPRKKPYQNHGGFIAINERARMQADHTSYPARTSHDPLTHDSHHMRHPTQAKTKLYSSNHPWNTKAFNSSPTPNSITVKRPSRIISEAPTEHPEPTNAGAASGCYTPASENSSEAETEMLDTTSQLNPPTPSSHCSKTNQQSQCSRYSISQRPSQSRSLFASQPSDSSSSQQTDRLEVLDSQGSPPQSWFQELSGSPELRDHAKKVFD